jgi:hypothetical protein
VAHSIRITQGYPRRPSPVDLAAAELVPSAETDVMMAGVSPREVVMGGAYMTKGFYKQSSQRVIGGRRYTFLCRYLCDEGCRVAARSLHKSGPAHTMVDS